MVKLEIDIRKTICKDCHHCRLVTPSTTFNHQVMNAECISDAGAGGPIDATATIYQNLTLHGLQGYANSMIKYNRSCYELPQP